MHLHNLELGEKGDPGYVSRFGFHVDTYCGIFALSNQWEDTWPVRSGLTGSTCPGFSLIQTYN